METYLRAFSNRILASANKESDIATFLLKISAQENKKEIKDKELRAIALHSRGKVERPLF
ncbi:hypothetical protein HC931_06250 [Candidatus Gracilibacteria bacterium]|nr:hypothetical protein [Candidatus Gracilibacteria bacterium]